MSINHKFRKENYYEGATTDYKIAYRGLLTGVPEQIAARELTFLKNRSEHVCRNTPIVSAALSKYLITLSSLKVKWKKRSAGKVKKAKIIQELWEEVAANPNLDGYGTFHNTQVMWNRAMFCPGEAISRMVIKKRDGIRIPIALQHIDSAFLDPAFTGDGFSIPNLKNGIQFKHGKPFKYHFNKEDKSIPFILPTGITTDKVVVNASEILHLFVQDRPGQYRGIPKPASALLPIYALGDLQSATINKQLAASAVAWVIEKTNPLAPIAIGTSHVIDNNGNLVEDTGQDGKRVHISTSGETQYLDSNEIIKFHQAEGIGNNYDSLILNETRNIIQSLGVTYQQVTGDLSGISFSALKYIVNEIRASADFHYTSYLIALGIKPFLNKFLELCQVQGYNINSVYPCFIYPKRYRLDDLKDIQADILEVANDFVPMADKLEERGYEYEDIQHDNDLRSEFPSIEKSGNGKLTKASNKPKG